MWSEPARVSTSCTWMSGLTPGVILRKTFISESSPKATDEFDCSPEKSVEWVSRSRSWPAQPVEGQAARQVGPVAAGLARGVGEGAQPQAHRLAVVERVVRVDPAELGLLPPPQEGVVEPGLRVRVERQRHLVDLGAARAGPRR